MNSPAKKLAERFRPLGPDEAVRVALAAWDQLTILEQAALALDRNFWLTSAELEKVEALEAVSKAYAALAKAHERLALARATASDEARS